MCVCVLGQVRGRDGARDGDGAAGAARGRHVPAARAAARHALAAAALAQRHALRALAQVSHYCLILRPLTRCSKATFLISLNSINPSTFQQNNFKYKIRDVILNAK